MPYYDYKCTECGQILTDISRSIKEDVATMDCPKCGEMMKHLFSAPIIEFKGNGFYQTDYKKKSIDAPNKENTSTGTDKS